MELFLTHIPSSRIAQESDKVKNALEQEGLLIITNVIRLEQEFESAILDLEKCRARTMAGINSMGVFEEMRIRRLVGESSDQSTLRSCGTQISPIFRSMIHNAGTEVAKALGRRAVEFVQGGTHKQLFHRYTNREADELGWHRDAGVFLAMTSANRDNDTPYTIEVKDQWGNPATVTIPRDAILIMGGEAFGKSEELLGFPIRAVEHRATLKGPEDNVRFWFGEMFLPKDDFLIDTPEGHIRMKDWLNHKNASAIGCMESNSSSEEHSVILRDLRATCDGADHRFCWMQCIDTKTQECRDKSTGKMCPDIGYNHQKTCEIIDKSPEAHYCMPNTGMSMYMEGFTSGFASDDSQGCLTFYFPGLELDALWKFILANLCIIGLGILSEFLLNYRRKLARASMPIRPWQENALFGASVTVGYIIMLATMTYSYELFASVVIGLVIGHALFTAPDKKNNEPIRTACCM